MAPQLRKAIFFITILSIGLVIWYFEAQKPEMGPGGEAVHIEKMNKEEKARMYDPAIELTGTQEFINSEPFRLADYIGKKVILIDFWTYSCINCQRTTPYLNAWWEKYKDKGLLIVGVHTPEFEFEKDYGNVLAATEKFGIKYPVVQDNNYSTWRAYSNRYWPRKYLIDIDGYIVYDHIGEGAYEETEMKIQDLLNERMIALGEDGGISREIVRVGGEASRASSPETYFGSLRNSNFGSGIPGRSGTFNFSEPSDIKKNILYLDGSWKIDDEYSQNISAGARIIFRYNAKEVYFVANSDDMVGITVLQDGKPLGSAAGDNISKDSASRGSIKDSQLYKLINNVSPGEHILEIIIESPGLRAFTFTFG